MLEIVVFLSFLLCFLRWSWHHCSVLGSRAEPRGGASGVRWHSNSVRHECIAGGGEGNKRSI